MKYYSSLYYWIGSFTILIKAKIVLAFLPCKGLTQAYLVIASNAHNKYLTPQFLEDDYPISAKSATQLLPLNLP